MRTIVGMSGLVCVFLLSACGGEAPPQDTLSTDNKADSTQAIRTKKTKNIFHNIPSPVETAGLLKKAGAEYEKDLLNDPNRHSKYTSASKQAVNLGIYGADLSYASVFNNTQEGMLFSAAAQNLAKKLDVSIVFGQETMDRLEKNQQNRDSLLNIVSETYWNVDGYLKENGRDNISALMIAGGWVEGLYIACQVAGQHDTPELRQRIAEQKLPLGELIELIGTYSVDDAAVAGTMADLKAISDVFGPVTVASAASKVTQENGTAVIGSSAPAATITDEQLKAINEKVTAVRNSYIN